MIQDVEARHVLCLSRADVAAAASAYVADGGHVDTLAWQWLRHGWLLLGQREYTDDGPVVDQA